MEMKPIKKTEERLENILDSECLEIVISKGCESLAESLKEKRVKHLDIGEYIDFKSELLDPDSYVNPDLEPSMVDVIKGEVVVLNGESLWPENLKPFLIEGDVYLLAYIYNNLKNKEVRDDDSGKEIIKNRRAFFYTFAREKSFELARNRGMLDKLVQHYLEFLPDYLSYAEDKEEILKREQANVKALYKKFGGK